MERASRRAVIECALLYAPPRRWGQNQHGEGAVGLLLVPREDARGFCEAGVERVAQRGLGVLDRDRERRAADLDRGLGGGGGVVKPAGWFGAPAAAARTA